MSIDFSELYSPLKERYTDIKQLNEAEIDFIQKQVIKINAVRKTNRYLMAVITAIIFFLIAPAIVIKTYSSLSIITAYIENRRITFSNEAKDILNLSFGLCASSIIFYFFILPSLRINSKFKELHIFIINRRQRNFVFSAIIGTYISFGLIGLLIYLNVETLSGIILANFKYYLLIPLFVLTNFLLIFILASTLRAPLRRLIARESESLIDNKVDICIRLLVVLRILDSYERFFFSEKDFNRIVSNLKSIALTIKVYTGNISGFSLESQNEFLMAGIEFEKNIDNLVSIKESNLHVMKSSIVNYLNIFLDGDLSKLPKSSVIPQSLNNRKVKFYQFILLGLYLTLPIFVVIFLKAIFNISLDSYTQSLMRILYIVWAFVGIFSNPIILNNETKDLLKDIFKTITGKI